MQRQPPLCVHQRTSSVTYCRWTGPCWRGNWTWGPSRPPWLQWETPLKRPGWTTGQTSQSNTCKRQGTPSLWCPRRLDRTDNHTAGQIYFNSNKQAEKPLIHSVLMHHCVGLVWIILGLIFYSPSGLFLRRLAALCTSATLVGTDQGVFGLNNVGCSILQIQVSTSLVNTAVFPDHYNENYIQFCLMWKNA